MHKQRHLHPGEPTGFRSPGPGSGDQDQVCFLKCGIVQGGVGDTPLLCTSVQALQDDSCVGGVAIQQSQEPNGVNLYAALAGESRASNHCGRTSLASKAPILSSKERGDSSKSREAAEPSTPQRAGDSTWAGVGVPEAAVGGQMQLQTDLPPCKLLSSNALGLIISLVVLESNSLGFFSFEALSPDFYFSATSWILRRDGQFTDAYC